tara:strand:- start:2526 stop:3533 length:1008 start_codon:yes stop_codon:yes gene_type:complete
MNRVFYIDDAIPSSILTGVKKNIENIPWCRAPAGIPGNTVPRNVSVLGDGKIIKGNDKLVLYKTEKDFGKSFNVSYPMFQCAKSSSNIYHMRRIPYHLARFVLHLRKKVKELYKDRCRNVDRMFNVVICNNYTENIHQINAHRDDERWLEHNEIGDDGNPCASIIASLTLYPDGEPDVLRSFEIQDDETQKWNNIELKDNSVVFFSNHMHRAKAYPKTLEHKNRINLTFRTILPGLLGRVGYGNFYRYMSIPYHIKPVGDKNLERISLFVDSIKKSNIFNDMQVFNENIIVTRIDQEYVTRLRSRYKKYIDLLPSNVKSLCSVNLLEDYAYDCGW